MLFIAPIARAFCSTYGFGPGVMFSDDSGSVTSPLWFSSGEALLLGLVFLNKVGAGLLFRKRKTLLGSWLAHCTFGLVVISPASWPMIFVAFPLFQKHNNTCNKGEGWYSKKRIPAQHWFRPFFSHYSLGVSRPLLSHYSIGVFRILDPSFPNIV